MNSCSTCSCTCIFAILFQDGYAGLSLKDGCEACTCTCSGGCDLITGDCSCAYISMHVHVCRYIKLFLSCIYHVCFRWFSLLYDDRSWMQGAWLAQLRICTFSTCTVTST